MPSARSASSTRNVVRFHCLMLRSHLSATSAPSAPPPAHLHHLSHLSATSATSVPPQPPQGHLCHLSTTSATSAPPQRHLSPTSAPPQPPQRHLRPLSTTSVPPPPPQCHLHHLRPLSGPSAPQPSSPSAVCSLLVHVCGSHRCHGVTCRVAFFFFFHLEMSS